MHKIGALIRAGWLAATSYRFGVVMSFASLIVGVVPVYFVTRALQSTMSNVIVGEGDQFFAFIIVGMASLTLISATLYALPTALQTGTATGTIEAMLATPTGVPTLLAGLAGYDVLYALLRATVVLLAAAVMGAHLPFDRILAVLPVVALVILAHIPIGVVAAAMVLAFRTPGPLPQLVFMLSTFLGGVYYPTRVIPGAVRVISDFVPLTYGLKAIRVVLLEGKSLASVSHELLVLAGFAIGLTIISTVAFRAALGYARRAGTLAQY
ncbi:MAG TPA: ABC transporter permease [Gemmatimonadaceae bacterium]|nr:ABC transporter permease [Gemmatimonadaceae bacterium]